MSAGEDLARHHPAHEPLHPDRSHQRERPGTVYRREEPLRVRPVLVAMEAVAHSVLHLLDGEAGIGTQLHRALADGCGIAARIPQLDSRAGTRGQLAADLHPQPEPGLQVLRPLPRCRLGSVAVGQHGVLARVDDVPGDAVRLADGRDPDRDSFCRPVLARFLQPLLVVVAKLLELHPRGAGSLRAFQQLQRPAAGGSVGDGCRHFSGTRPDARRQRPLGDEGDLLPPFEHAHGDQRLSAGERQAARVEKLERIVRRGRPGEEIVLCADSAREQRAAEDGEKPATRRLHPRWCVRST